MRRAICILSLLLAARGAAAQQDTTLTQVQRDSAAAADSAALVAELSGIQARSGGDTVPDAGPVQRLLPDISVVGDLVADASPDGSTQEGGERFLVREIEIAAGAAVDPYFRGDVFLGVSDEEGVAIEQAFLTTTALPAGVEVRLGRFLMPVTRLNLTHREALHTVEFPWVYQRFLGPEGLKGTGVQASRVFSPFGFYQELLVTIVDGLGEPVEGLSTAEPINRRLGGLGYSARLRNYLDLSQASNVELAFSALTGERAQAVEAPEGFDVTAVARRQTTVGADFTYRWRPLQQGLYRSLIVQAEVMRQINGDPGETVTLPGGGTVDFLGPRRDYTGAFAFARYQLTRRAFLGARYDWLEDPQGDGEALNAASAYLEFFPSEFSKLIASFERYEPGEGDGANRILLQAVFALGPHKPHPF
jgi:hypothetical protein